MEDWIESTRHTLYNSDRNANKDTLLDITANSDINKKQENLDSKGEHLYVCIPKEKKNFRNRDECIITNNKIEVFELLKNNNLEINIYKKV
jgi:hypothetical protein